MQINTLVAIFRYTVIQYSGYSDNVTTRCRESWIRAQTYVLAVSSWFLYFTCLKLFLLICNMDIKKWTKPMPAGHTRMCFRVLPFSMSAGWKMCREPQWPCVVSNECKVIDHCEGVISVMCSVFWDI